MLGYDKQKQEAIRLRVVSGFSTKREALHPSRRLELRSRRTNVPLENVQELAFILKRSPTQVQYICTDRLFYLV
jgi:hypothetical protein